MSQHTAKHSARTRARTRWLIGGAVTVAMASTAAAAVGATRGSGGKHDEACTEPRTPIEVAVAPELAPVVQQVAQRLAAAGSVATGCVRLDVVAQQPASVADSITARTPRRPDAWIPDSSWWAQRVTSAGVPLAPDRPSVASSPVVLAVSPQLAARVGAPRSATGFRSLLSAPAGAAALALPNPERDAATSLTLLGLTDAAGTATARSGLAELLNGSARAALGLPARVAAAATSAVGAVPASEQAVLAQDGHARSRRVVALYPPSSATLDYPFLVLTQDPSTQRWLSALRAALQAAPAQGQLAALGFRTPDGTAPASDSPDVDAAPRRPASVDSSRIDAALRVTNLLSTGTRMLAVIDVSGSMADAVPGTTGQTRLDVTKAAAAQGLAAYTDGADIGLWVFSRHLSAGADYRPLVPIGPLGRRGDGTIGRARLAQALAQVKEVHGGGTALYTTVLAAVREVRSGWDRGRVNSVVLLTDGRDDGEGGPSLSALLATLHREADPARPVPVITVGLGGGTDTAALAAISRATGGSSFLSRDGNDAFHVLAEAIGQRACRPNC